MIREPANDNFEILPERKKVASGTKKKTKIIRDKETIRDDDLK